MGRMQAVVFRLPTASPLTFSILVLVLRSQFLERHKVIDQSDLLPWPNLNLESFHPPKSNGSPEIGTPMITQNIPLIPYSKSPLVVETELAGRTEIIEGLGALMYY